MCAIAAVRHRIAVRDLKIVIRIAALLCALLALAAASLRAQDCAPPEPGPRTLLKLGEVIAVGIVTGERNGSYQFSVTEALEGLAGGSVTVMPLPNSGGLQIGKQYLLFANWFTFDDGKRVLTIGPCGLTRSLDRAQSLLEQLRAEEAGRRVASVYGMLVRTTDPVFGISTEAYERPLPGIVITLESRGKKLETTTDEHGAYAFEYVPPGTYQVLAQLPAGLALGEPLKQGSPPPFELPRKSSFDCELFAMPTGSITGQVIGPDGNALRSTSVELYTAEEYRPDSRGDWSSEGEGKPFQFDHLPPGEYVLVFDRTNDPSPDDPFSRTFYPDAADLAHANRIHLSNGQQLANIDIHVANPWPTRQIRIQLNWAGNTPSAFYSPDVVVTTTKRHTPYPFKSGNDAYTLNLFLDAQYTIKAEAYCRLPARGKLTSPDVVVDGGDIATSEVKLVLDHGGCVPK
jgi:hypothetical protein